MGSNLLKEHTNSRHLFKRMTASETGLRTGEWPQRWRKARPRYVALVSARCGCDFANKTGHALRLSERVPASPVDGESYRGILTEFIVQAGTWHEPVFGLDRADGPAALHDRGRRVFHTEALPAKVERQVAQIDLVLHIVLENVGRVIEVPIGAERVALELQRRATRHGAAGQRIEAPRLTKIVALIPAAKRQLAKAEIVRIAAEYALAADRIFGRADRDRCSGGDGT